MGRPTSIYSLELVSPSGNILADLSSRASQRTFTVTRNGADDIQWYLSIDELEDYCRKTYQDPKLLLVTNQTEVRVKRNGTYMAAGQLSYKYGSLAENGSGNLIQLKASGFLNLFTQRFTGPGQIYTNMDASAIAWDLINQSQQGNNDPTGTLNTTTGLIIPGTATSGVPIADWNFGITQGSLATVGPHTRTYQNMAISDALQDFCNVSVGGFDMQFTYNKVFNTFIQLGVQRPDIVLEYPGTIIEADITEDGTQMANLISAQGTGNGTVTQSQYTAPNTGSTANYKVRQSFISPSSLDASDDSLQNYATWNLAQFQVPLVLPSIIYNTHNGPSPTDFSVGDWIHIKIRNHPLYSDVDGMYRTEQIQVTIDESDNEQVTIITSLA
ncbi:MAG TPA: hypothetical protein VNG51_19495 [Ktedonobacteraceae bacterium]|nr:hypothetical protein [Ktedonobacteraceae bacterium]